MDTKSRKLNSVFYADTYHPIQAGSIDGTDVVPHDKAIHRAHLCHKLGLYDPHGDPKATMDPYCTVFVGRLNRQTTEDTIHQFMSNYGQIKSLRLVRDIVTGASRGYAFVEYETEKEMRHAYMDAHHTIIDDNEIIVDYNRQKLMPGWIPRRLGGGLGGKKESGQLRFGGREKPFRAPLKPIPYEELEKLGIPPPPEGRYQSRNQVLSHPLLEEKGAFLIGKKARREEILWTTMKKNTTERAQVTEMTTHVEGALWRGAKRGVVITMIGVHLRKNTDTGVLLKPRDILTREKKEMITLIGVASPLMRTNTTLLCLSACQRLPDKFETGVCWSMDWFNDVSFIFIIFFFLLFYFILFVIGLLLYDRNPICCNSFTKHVLQHTAHRQYGVVKLNPILNSLIL